MLPSDIKTSQEARQYGVLKKSQILKSLSCGEKLQARLTAQTRYSWGSRSPYIQWFSADLT